MCVLLGIAVVCCMFVFVLIVAPGLRSDSELTAAAEHSCSRAGSQVDSALLQGKELMGGGHIQ